MHIFASLKKARFTIKAPLMVIACLAISIAAAVYLSYKMHEKELLEIKYAELTDVIQKIQSDIDETSALAVSSASMLARIPEIVEAFHKEDREWLVDELKPMFLIQKEKYFVSNIQFYNPEARTFLRLFKAGGYGELTKLEMVIEANKEKSAKNGVEYGSSGLGIRGVAPIFDDSGFLGTVAISFLFKDIIAKYKVLTSSEIGIFFDSKLSGEAKSSKDKALADNKYAEEKSNIIGDFTYGESTSKEKIFLYINKNNLKRSSKIEVVFPVVNNEHMGIIFYPLVNFSGKIVGKIVVTKSFEDLHVKFYKRILWEIIDSIVRIIILSSIVFVVFNGLTLYPLIELKRRCTLVLRGKNVSLMGFSRYNNQLNVISSLISLLHPALTANTKVIDEESGMENKYTSECSEDDVMNYGFQNDTFV